jgi:hypothetical protein
MCGLYINDVKGTCSPITDTICVKYKEKNFTVVLGLKSQVVTMSLCQLVNTLIEECLKLYTESN